MMNFENHPCFNDRKRHEFARIHLPVAPKCNIQCNYCDRKYDCVNESRPGVTSSVLSPGQALAYLEKMMEKIPNITVMGIAGPGDPFANPQETMETLRLVRNRYPDMMLCLASNGLGLPPYIDELAGLKVSHVTLTMNGIDPFVTSRIYSWVRDDKKIYRGIDGAALLLQRQIESVKRLKQYGILTKINIILIPGINDHHILDTVRRVKELGADIVNIIPMHPNKDTVFENIPEPDKTSVGHIRAEAQKILPMMHHCTRCRADAVGLIEEEMKDEFYALLQSYAKMALNPQENRPYAAIASHEGYLVNQHLGEAEEFFIFSNDSGTPRLLEKRSAPEKGNGDRRWNEMAAIFNDCSAVFVSWAGANPVNILRDRGVQVIQVQGMIVPILTDYFSGNELSRYTKREGCGKGMGCTGTGGGCG
jgi:nitrogen fixation protein NifB